MPRSSSTTTTPWPAPGLRTAEVFCQVVGVVVVVSLSTWPLLHRTFMREA